MTSYDGGNHVAMDFSIFAVFDASGITGGSA